MSFLQTLLLFSAPIGGVILGFLVYLDNRRDQKRLSEMLDKKR